MAVFVKRINKSRFRILAEGDRSEGGGSRNPRIREGLDTSSVPYHPTQPFKEEGSSLNNVSPGVGTARLERRLEKVIFFKILGFENFGSKRIGALEDTPSLFY